MRRMNRLWKAVADGLASLAPELWLVWGPLLVLGSVLAVLGLGILDWESNVRNGPAQADLSAGSEWDSWWVVPMMAAGLAVIGAQIGAAAHMVRSLIRRSRSARTAEAWREVDLLNEVEIAVLAIQREWPDAVLYPALARAVVLEALQRVPIVDGRQVAIGN